MEVRPGTRHAARAGHTGREGARFPRPVVLMTVSACCLLLSACGNAPSILDPRGPAAAIIASLWWVMLVLATTVYLLVIAVLLIGLARGPRGQPSDKPGPPGSKRWIQAGGILMPAVILLGLVGYTLWTETALAALSASPRLRVEVIGHDWWWEVAYPDRRVITANEIHIPVGEPVEVSLTSTDVIHSFWVPQLHGKLDLIPGRTNVIVIEASEPGVYQGQCAEYCGIQHANMGFVVVARPADEFEAWVARQAQPAMMPTGELAQRGQSVFLSTTCVGCHTIQGTSATGALGPDLTHLASRRTLAAAPVLLSFELLFTPCSRILQRGIFALSPQLLELTALTREAAATVAPPASSLDIEAPPELWLVADPDQLRQAIENLLRNALQHSPPDRRVLVRLSTDTRPDGVSNLIEVCDAGPGIPPEMLPHVFDRFVAGPGTTGLGIGLYLARGIAEAHRGTLTVESRVGQGTTFRLALPPRNDGVAQHRGAGPELQARRNRLSSERNATGG